jgi:glucosamine--fructose-6-phosphate aminotransferase (isomerizing)
LRSSVLFALARGYRFCSAFETALKLMECALLPCKAYSTADFEHGPKALAKHGTAALVYGEAPDGIESAGCVVAMAPTQGPDECQPIFDALYGQWVALLTARARGLDPDTPEGLSKVTRTL